MTFLGLKCKVDLTPRPNSTMFSIETYFQFITFSIYHFQLHYMSNSIKSCPQSKQQRWKISMVVLSKYKGIFLQPRRLFSKWEVGCSQGGNVVVLRGG